MIGPVQAKRAATRRQLLGAAALVLAACNAVTGVNDISFTAVCKVAVDCDDGDPCDVEACREDGTCASSPLPDGPAVTQIPGDCRQAVCEAGTAIQEADPSDVDDANPCTEDACSGGEAAHTPLDDVVCELGAATGVCRDGTCVVKCDSAADCDDGEPCTIDACDVASQVCVFEPNHGAFVENADPTDCLQIVCNQDTAATVPNDGEVPDDSNECTDDACVSGVPQHTPVAVGTTCAAGKCNANGQCAGCTVPGDCAGVDDECQHRTCVNRICGLAFEPAGSPGVPQLAQTSADCAVVACDGQGGTMLVPDDTDLPPEDGNPCTVAACSGGAPSQLPLAVDSPCQGGVCNATGICVECNSVNQCSAAGTCKQQTCTNNTCGTVNVAAGSDPNNQCNADPVSSCGQTGVCNGSGACALHPMGTVCEPASCSNSIQTAAGTCNGAGTCISGATTSCAPYVCGGTVCKTSCSGSNDCQMGYTCASGACKLATGSSCSSGGQCATGFCVDGFCCNTACNTVCKACSAAKTPSPNGTCANIDVGTDPDSDCFGNQVCCSGMCSLTCN